MSESFGIGFAAPWLLLALLALPVLWFLLRAIPPAPKRQLFPAVTLLLGLGDKETQVHRTPWWLLLLRLLALAAVIVGLAGPVLNPSSPQASTKPLLLVIDASWAGAAHWAEKRKQLQLLMKDAARANRPVALMSLTEPRPLQFQPADAQVRLLAGVLPRPWQPSHQMLTTAARHVTEANQAFDTLWLSDGLAFAGATETRADLIAALLTRGTIEVVEDQHGVVGLMPAVFEDGAILLQATRATPGAAREHPLHALGLDPGGQERVLATATLQFEAGAKTATVRLSLPTELRARVSRFSLADVRSAGAVALSDARLRRRDVALISSQAGNEGLALLSPLHYLREALAPSANLLEGRLADLLPAKPDVIVLADVAHLPADQEEALVDWVTDGGLLLRFAGPRLAASDTARDAEEPLMPVRLRIGGRSIGGAMSWGDPKALAPFAEGSPFFKLEIPEEVTVRSQVAAQPDPELANRVIAELADGTPLVTRKELGQGQVVLFHVTANAEWSSLPLSGLFIKMLERLAVSSATKAPDATDLAGTVWQPIEVLDGFGHLRDAGTQPGVAGPALIEAASGPDLWPGVYQSGKRRLARNVLPDGAELQPAVWPPDIPVRAFEASPERPLGGALLSAALVLMALDVAASLLVSGLWSRSKAAKGAAALAVAMIFFHSPPAPAQTAAELAAELRLGHVLTGDSSVDATAAAGLRGLSDVLRNRTSVEPAAPVGVNLDRDELALFSILYWPMTAQQPMPSAEAYGRLNTYLANGGMIFFDTRDADLSGTGRASPAARRLQQIALSLDIPPLETVPRDHVLTRTFYLLQDFPGRHLRGMVWVEAAASEPGATEGVPFRQLNDGVTPVVIGGNDWASAWAVDASGAPMYPVGRGYGGERQRELARRFGVNLVMHVLTGNYKSDQVHVPALLDRLGQ